MTEKLSKMEENMLTIIYQYKEKANLAASHGQRMEDEHAKVSTLQMEREARERVIESLHMEAMRWMDRFYLTLNGSQKLPRLLARAKAMADMYSAPDEVCGLFDYCQHMVELMTHIIRNRGGVCVVFMLCLWQDKRCCSLMKMGFDSTLCLY